MSTPRNGPSGNLPSRQRRVPRVLLVHADGTRENFDYSSGDEGLMWRYDTPDGPRWIGWRALAEKVERFLEDGAP
jgi:hypothetical protein